MADPYVPPSDPEERAIEIALDPWVAYSRYALWFCGIVYVLFGLGGGPLVSMGFWVDPETQGLAIPMTIVFTLIMLVICGGFGLLNFVAAFGIGRGAKWGWFLTVILGGIYLPSACLPFGAVLLYGMLNDKTRKLFLG